MIKGLFIFLLILGVIVAFLALASGSKKQETKTEKQAVGTNLLSATESRGFYMGFSPWPPDLTFDAVNRVYKFIKGHSDIVLHHLDAGIPWPEALDNREFSKHLKDDWSMRKDQTTEMTAYLAISPINFERDGLAIYWGEKDNMPLPNPWKNYRFNDQQVKTAFLNYAKRVIEYFNPKYLAIGIESNILLSKSPDKWSDYKQLNEYVYTELKKSYPDLVIFSTIQYEDLRGITDDPKNNQAKQVTEVKELMKHSDVLALSSYHFGVNHNKVSDNYFDLALTFNKTLAIAESGAISKDLTLLGNNIKADQEDQARFVGFILKEASKHNFLFVINWVAIDFDKLLEKIPGPVKEIAKAWVYTGLQDIEGNNKEALEVWDSYFKLPKK